MYNLILYIIVFLVSSGAFAQQVILVKQDGTSLSTTVSAFSETHLYTKDGKVSLNEIDSANFVRFVNKDENLYSRLSLHGVLVSHGVVSESDFHISQSGVANGRNSNSKAFRSEVRSTNFDDTQRINLMIHDIQLFNKQRSLGKGMQLAGIGLSLLGAAAGIGDTQGSRLNTQRTIAYFALGSYLIGVVIDLNAGKHLRNMNRLKK